MGSSCVILVLANVLGVSWNSYLVLQVGRYPFCALDMFLNHIKKELL